MMIALLLASLSCVAVDGDTLRCGAERVRLVGIDAPEMPGHCRPGRVCVAGDPSASKASLARLLTTGPVAITRLGTDHYGRTLAQVTAGGVDVGCAQLKAGQAVYVAKWDKGGRVKEACGL